MNREILNAVAIVTIVIAAAVGGPLLARELRSLPHSKLAARADQRIVTLEVGGMTCAGCSGAVKSQLEEVTGVSTVAVRYEQRRAYVVCERSLADTALTAAIERAGPGFMAQVVTR